MVKINLEMMLLEMINLEMINQMMLLAHIFPAFNLFRFICETSVFRRAGVIVDCAQWL